MRMLSSHRSSFPADMRRALLPEGGETLGVTEVKQGEAGGLLNVNFTGHKSGTRSGRYELSLCVPK